MKRFIEYVCLAALVATPVYAHEGEDHSGDAPALVSSSAPRAHAATEEFELLATLREGKLIVYLDRYTTNEPVTNADIELQAGAVQAKGVLSESGVYEFPGEPFTAPGRYALGFSVQAGDTADLLNATLEVVAPAPTPHATSGWLWVTALAAALLVLLAAVWKGRHLFGRGKRFGGRYA